MGNGLYYAKDGHEYYQCDGTIITDSAGLSGKVVTEISDTDYHSSLPTWSKTSEIYFKRDDDGNHEIEQMRLFNKRRVSLDFDWNHKHKEFPKGVVHVHEWYSDRNGNWVRKKHPRFMNDDEIATYGEIILLANPNARLRP